jgi:orotate phosphoribosyltransferase
VTTIRPAQQIAARAAIAARTEELFRASGALRSGHFRLRGGRHGDAYVETLAVLADPAATSELCRFWAAEARTPEGRAAVDVVAGGTTGGVILAWETARQLGVRAGFADEMRDPVAAGRHEPRRALGIEGGERVLLVYDILGTGGSLLATLLAVEELGGEIVGCVVLVDRSGVDRATIESPVTGRVYPLRSLWRLSLPTYAPGPAGCPRCAAGDAIDAPGSTGPASA